MSKRFHMIVALIGLLAAPSFQQTGPLRTIEFETSQVTSPSVAITPDGKDLIFTMLGKLFRIPVTGGTAEQLTFGPYYDADPAVSPDGKLVAFGSDRDGSEENIFVLDLATKEIRQITRENQAQRPAWAPDGASIVYIRFEPETEERLATEVVWPREIKQIALDGTGAKVIRPKGFYNSAVYLPDGRLAWTALDRGTIRVRSGRIEAMSGDGKVETIRTFDHPVDRLVASKTPPGMLVQATSGDLAVAEVTFVPTSGHPRKWMNASSDSSSFAIAPDGRSLYAGTMGNLWKVELPAATQMRHVPMTAKVKLEIRPMTPPRPWKPAEPGEMKSVRAILSPALLPNNKGLIFSSLGDTWLQPTDGSAARRVVSGVSAGTDIAASPDGTELAFVMDPVDKDPRIDVVNLETGKVRTVAPESRCGYEHLSWAPHTELIAATACEHDVLSIDTASSTNRVIAKSLGRFEPFPHLTADRATLILRAKLGSAPPGFYRLGLSTDAKPELLRATTSWDGRARFRDEWIAEIIDNSTGIRLMNLADPKKDRVFIEPDGQDFSFTPDGTAIVYTVADQVWVQPLDGSARREIPIRFRSTVPDPQPVLIRRAKLLDLDTGLFGSESTILISGGRIKLIGNQPGSNMLPKNTKVIDAEGRYAIPGLFEMHGHQDTCGGKRELAYGVTTVRNMGGRIELLNGHSDASDLTDQALPRCFQPGRILESVNGRVEDWFFVHPKNPEEAREYVRRAHRQGADFIKLYQRLTWSMQRAASDEARRLGLPVVAHTAGVEGTVKGLTLGYSGLTHTLPPFQDIRLMMAKAGAHWDPTIGVHAGRGLGFRRDPARFRPLNPQPNLSDIAIQGVFYQQLQTIRSAHKLGIPIVAGTDALAGGIALHWELEFFEEAGLAPIEVLRSATIVSASVLGADRHLGSLEVGKLADIVLLDADPLNEIRNAQKVWRVLKGGFVFDPKELVVSNPR